MSRAKLGLWFAETRPPFLLLSVALVFLGTSIAIYEGFFIPLHFVLALIGLTLLHISVNVLNDYYDFRMGIDLETKRTPFSGGSGILPGGLLKPESVCRFGVVCLFLGVIIGIFFLARMGWFLLPLILVGAIAVGFYNLVFAKVMLGELFAGLGLGTLSVLGSYFVQTGSYSHLAMVASIPSLILTHNLLFLNEFPDMDADRKGGRRNLVIFLGRQKASWLYSILTISVFGWIIAWTAIGLLPRPVLISLLILPVVIKSVRGALEHHSSEALVPALAANVMVVLLTQALMGAGFIVASLLKI